MNPFVYAKSFHNKSYPKRIGTLTPPNPKISLIHQKRPGQIGLKREGKFTNFLLHIDSDAKAE